MVCQTISYQNFRNIEEASLTFEEGVNILIGRNAEGKTNALEGIFLFAGGRSHRTSHEREFLRDGFDFAALKLTYKDCRRTNTLSLRYLPQKGGSKDRGGCRKICQKNEIAIRRMSEFIGNFRAVLFCPEHLAIVREGPRERRTFLDGAISQCDPFYMADLQRYSSVLQQRNHLLSLYFENRRTVLDTIEFWSLQLSQLAESIGAKRELFVKKLSDLSADILSDMSQGRESLKLSYRKALSASEYLKLLLENIEREAKFGSTLYGIHRDDVDIFLGGKSARSFASQGQQRSIAIAMKLSEGEIANVASGEYPVLLLDDILSELDERRKGYILSGFTGGHPGRQIILTCCDGESSGIAALKDSVSRRYLVEKGSYTNI